MIIRTTFRQLLRISLLMPMALGVSVFGVSKASAEHASVTLDPERTHISFQVDSTLHLIAGTASLKDGSLEFDSLGGPAQGRIVIDATSLDTDNRLRDYSLHGNVLESEKFPEIAFRAQSLRIEKLEPGRAEVVVAGQILLHGSEWPISIPATVRAGSGAPQQGVVDVQNISTDEIQIHAEFIVPFVEWGLRDMSNFALSVDPEAKIEIDAIGKISPSSLLDSRTPQTEQEGSQ